MEDIKTILENYKEETNRHFDVVAEDLKSEIQTVAEGVTANTERIDALSEQVAANTETLEVIKFDIEIIKNDLKQKVGRDEFIVLERRVGILEAKSR
jgi:predicted  nucleic acid-binding Zn-ribbon protein